MKTDGNEQVQMSHPLHWCARLDFSLKPPVALMSPLFSSSASRVVCGPPAPERLRKAGVEVPGRTDIQNQPSPPHQVGRVLIPARMENTFDLPGNLKFRRGKDAEALLSVCVGAGSPCRAMVLLRVHFMTCIK